MLIFKTYILNEKPVEFLEKKMVNDTVQCYELKSKKINLLSCYNQPVIELTIFVETFMQTIKHHHLCHCALFLYTNKKCV